MPEVEGRALIKRHMNLRILIVEDDATFVSALNDKISVLWREFPDAEITMVRTLWRAMDIAQRTPAPDIILFDLTLLDATAEETAQKIAEIQDRSAIVVISGHSIDRIRKILPGQEVEILVKDVQLWKGGRIIRAMVSSMQRRHVSPVGDVYEILGTMKQLADKIDATHKEI